MKIRLRTIREIYGDEIGDLLLDVESIESVECYDSPTMRGSQITMKPVISGFLGDEDRIYRMQTVHHVAESVTEISVLMGDLVKTPAK